MSSVNKATLIGRAGKDPEVRYLPNGDAVASLSIATSEKWKDKASGEMREQTEWHRLNFFGRQAEIVGEYVRVGDMLYVEGSIHTRKWQDKDGIDRYSTEIKCRELKLLTPKGSGQRDSDDGQDRAPRSQAPQRQQTQSSAPRGAPPQRQAAPRQPATHGSGFDDMDDDIPF